MDLHFPPWFPEKPEPSACQRKLPIRVRALRAVRHKPLALAAVGRLEARRNNVEEEIETSSGRGRAIQFRGPMPGEMSFNLDFPSVGGSPACSGIPFAKLFNWQFGRLRVTDIGTPGCHVVFSFIQHWF